MSPARSARRCGCTTSPAACASASSTSGSRPTPPSPTCRRCPRERLAGGYLYYDATTDDARLVLTVARTAAAHGAAVANRCRVVGAHQATGSGRSTAPTVDAGGRPDRRPCARGGQRRRRVGRRGPRARGGDEPRLDPAGQGRPHHGAVGEGAQRHRRRHPGAEGQAQPVRRAVGSPRPTARSSTPTSAPPTPTTTVRSTIRSARRTTSTTCSARSTTRSPPASPPTTSPASGPGCVRWSSRRRAGAPPTCPGAIASTTSPAGVITVTGGKLTTYREMAEDTVDDRARPSRPPRPMPDEAAAAARCRRLPATAGGLAGGPPRRPLRHPGRRGRGARRRRSEPRRAARPRPAVPARRGRVRRAPRDGDDARRRAAAADAGRTCSIAPSPSSCAPIVAELIARRARLGRRRDDAPGGRVPRARAPRRRPTPGRPRLRHDRRPVTAPTPPIELTGTAARCTGAVDVPDAAVDRAARS